MENPVLYEARLARRASAQAGAEKAAAAKEASNLARTPRV
jgi:hypothetical protein